MVDEVSGVRQEAAGGPCLPSGPEDRKAVYLSPLSLVSPLSLFLRFLLLRRSGIYKSMKEKSDKALGPVQHYMNGISTPPTAS